MYLTKWGADVHNDPQQQTRKNRSEREFMRVLDLNTTTMSGRVCAKDMATVYDVTTESCSCPDFQKRGLPCKHMYLLDAALEAEFVPSRKNKNVALILAILLGWCGIHRFYVGKAGTGILWFLTGGMFCFGWFVDIGKIACNRFTDGGGRRLRRSEG